MKRLRTSLALVLSLVLFSGIDSTYAADLGSLATLVTLDTSVKPQVNVSPVASDAQRLVQLQGVSNARRFSRLMGRQGPIPATAFIRSSDLSQLTASDRDELNNAGVTLDIDLRREDEAAASPDALASDPRFAYERISLLGTERMSMDEMMASLSRSPGETYVQWLDANQPQFRQVFERIAAHDKGTVLFHCTAGKDRTGVLAALLLNLAGVSRADIVHDYALSAYYLQSRPKDNAMSPQFKELIREHPEISARLASRDVSNPENMEAFLAALSRQYGDASGYLRTIGISDTQIEHLLRRLGQMH